MTSETSISILTQILEWFTWARVENQSVINFLCSALNLLFSAMSSGEITNYKNIK